VEAWEGGFRTEKREVRREGGDGGECVGNGGWEAGKAGVDMRRGV